MFKLCSSSLLGSLHREVTCVRLSCTAIKILIKMLNIFSSLSKGTPSFDVPFLNHKVAIVHWHYGDRYVVVNSRVVNVFYVTAFAHMTLQLQGKGG